MKKKINASILISILAISTLSACGKESTVADNTEITSDYDVKEEVSLLPWIQLGLLDTHPELRSRFDTIFGVTSTTLADANSTVQKGGAMYQIGSRTTNNSNLLIALGMTTFQSKLNSDTDSISDLAFTEYTDIDEDSEEALYAVINAYFECLPDTEKGVFNGGASLTRAQAMALVTRATETVPESGIPAPNKTFTDAVGSNSYTDYAAQVNKNAYINTDNGLSESNFTSAMSQGEYISLLMNTIFKNSDDVSVDVEKALADTTGTKLSNIKDAGDISFSEAIKDAEKGCPSDMYETLSKAVALGIISKDDLEWDTAVTKSDAIKLFIDTAKAYYKLAGITSGEEATAKDSDTYFNDNDTNGAKADSSIKDVPDAVQAIVDSNPDITYVVKTPVSAITGNTIGASNNYVTNENYTEGVPNHRDPSELTPSGSGTELLDEDKNSYDGNGNLVSVVGVDQAETIYSVPGCEYHVYTDTAGNTSVAKEITDSTTFTNWIVSDEGQAFKNALNITTMQ